MKNGELNRLFAKTSRMHNKCSQAELLKSGITPGQPRILDFLYGHDGCIQRELSKNCDLKPATVTNILAGMEKADLIFRINDSTDRRILRVFLTDKGAQAQQKIDRAFAALEKDCFEDFSDQEKEALQIFLERIYFNLKKRDERYI
jgi:DNA-binding MarR family transcriptional regulator